MRKIFFMTAVLLLGIFVFKGADTKRSYYYVIKSGVEILAVENTLTKANGRAVIFKRTMKNITVKKVLRLSDIK